MTGCPQYLTTHPEFASVKEIFHYISGKGDENRLDDRSQGDFRNGTNPLGKNWNKINRITRFRNKDVNKEGNLGTLRKLLKESFVTGKYND